MIQLKSSFLLWLAYISLVDVSLSSGTDGVFDVLDYVNPLIGTIKGGMFKALNTSAWLIFK